MTPMTLSEAEALIAEWLRSDQKSVYANYGYDLYIPNVIRWHTRRDNPRVGEDEIVNRNSEAWSPVLASAAWDLCRRGILRPGVRAHNLQSTPDACAGFGFSLTPTGHAWLKDVDGNQFIPTASHRFAELLGGFRERYGDGFFSRSQEAVRCFQAMAYLACCAMSGAAAESIMLATAVAKDGSENKVLKMYRAANGRVSVRNLIVGAADQRLQRDFDTSLSLLNYWRDEAAHGVASALSSTEAELALLQLNRFALFMRDNWNTFTRKNA
jgi:hypothetical protein